MRRNIIIVICVLIAFFAIDRLIGKGCEYAFMNSQHTLDFHLKNAAMNDTSSIWLMGSSRTQHHFIPSQISDSLGESVFNAGIDGTMDIYFQYALLSLMLERHTPECVVLEVGNILKADCQKLSLLAPFTGLNQGLDSVMKQQSKYYGYAISHASRFNTTFVRHFLSMKKSDGVPYFKGYEPLAKTNKVFDKIQLERFEVNPEAEIYFKKFIDKCKSHGVTLILCASPYYGTTDTIQYQYFREASKTYDLPFVDYHTQGFLCDDPTYWADDAHLCSEGAEILSARFATDLKGILENK